MTPRSKSSTEPPAPGPLLEVGRVGKAHGLKGEVVVHLVTNRLERLAPGSTLSRRDGTTLVVAASRPFQGRHLVWFEGVTSREAADALRGAELLAPPIEDPDALFVHELIGCEVVDTAGAAHGKVVSIQHNPASDLLVGADGWLVPLRFVVAHEPGRIVVDVPDGLFE